MRVILHACGGAGINIAARVSGKIQDNKDLYGNVAIKYIDTSMADIRDYDVDKSSVHIINSGKVNSSVDGSGGVRQTLDAEISEDIKNYVDGLKLNKDDIHLVVSSGSGGSGSLIAPRLINLLKTLNQAVIYMSILDTSSVLYCDNSIMTLKQLELAGRKYKYSIPTVLADNADGVLRVDEVISTKIELLCILFNGTHKSLDTADMLMFANNAYTKDVHGIVSLSTHTEDTISELKDSFVTCLRVLSYHPSFRLDSGKLPLVHQYKQGFPNELVSTYLQIDSEADNNPSLLPLYFAITSNSHLNRIESIKANLVEKKSIIELKTDLFDDDDLNGIEI